jgi:hypothetical protein
MEIFAVLLILLIGSLAAPWLGTDSRNLRDHPWEIPWDRLPR